jgi:hypothetical protein
VPISLGPEANQEIDTKNDPEEERPSHLLARHTTTFAMTEQTA